MAWYFNVTKFLDEVSINHLIANNIVNRKTIQTWECNSYKPTLRTLVRIDNNIKEDILNYIEFDDVNTIGKRIEKLRVRAFMNYEELSDELGVAVSTIRHWESDRGKPSTKSINRMVELFCVSDRYILEGTDGK